MDKEQIKKQLEENGITNVVVWKCLMQRMYYAAIYENPRLVDDCCTLYKGLQEIFPGELIIKTNDIILKGIYPPEDTVSLVADKVKSILKEVGD